MARFQPFTALRFTRSIDLAAVTAPPYDVLAPADVRDLATRHTHNIVHVDVPAEPDRYQRAARLLRSWVDQGVLELDAEPSFTIYRVRYVDESGRARDQAGVLGALEVVDAGEGRVLPHERTTPKASTDRLDLTRATAANLSPVWGLSLASGLTAALAAPGEPVGAVEVDGVTHLVERVTDAGRISEISAIIGADDVLIADGHHRYGVARIYRDEVLAAAGPADGTHPAEATLAFVGELVPDQLAIAAIHRLYAGPTAVLVEALSRDFELARLGDDDGAAQMDASLLGRMTDEGALVLVTRDDDGQVQGHWLRPRPGAFDAVRSLDGAWLEHSLGDLVGTRLSVDYQHGVDGVLDALASGRADAAVLIRPTSIEEIERTAREGLLMPPKSTYFTPKLLTGLVIRPL